MYAVEFNTKIRDGRIDVPEQYRNEFVSDVKVILFKVDNSTWAKPFEVLMREAGHDKAFLSRTIDCSEDFELIDNEVSGEW
ncbi:MAG: hypothetical protein FWD03_05745 [Defluviitaleaceae bacterium]|nr:hypothetical protein [Defluviitaleaceae bacterium]